jgi:pSer/pThr/pTyr-binding forkhead associated (FHA) protein
MILLRSLSGRVAGSETVARHFPFQIGRSPKAGLRLEASGVWEQHCEIVRDTEHGLRLRSHPEALTLVNGQTAKDVVLRNGDVLELGEVRLQFWLSPARQTGLGLREVMTWAGMASLVAIQVGLMLWLPR